MSRRQTFAAGVGSRVPAALIARTKKTWMSSPRFWFVAGLTQGTKAGPGGAPPSRLHSNDACGSGDEKAKVALVTFVAAGGLSSSTVCGIEMSRVTTAVPEPVPVADVTQTRIVFAPVASEHDEGQCAHGGSRYPARYLFPHLRFTVPGDHDSAAPQVGWVIAPFEADETSAAYLANTPVV